MTQQQTAPILVTGGTGTLGRKVVSRLRTSGRDLRVLSRGSHESEPGIDYARADLATGDGVAPSLAGVRTVVHLAGGNKGDDVVAANLVAAVRASDVEHIVFISVIGADEVPVGWMRSQQASEQAIIESGVPYTILRAAQFNDLVLLMVEKMAKLPVVPMPGGLRFQPVDSDEVADRIVELALGHPAGRVADLAGPRIYTLRELVDSYLQTKGKHRMRLPVRIPGKAGKAYRAGDNLNTQTAGRGTRTWEEFLAAKIGGGSAQTESRRSA